MDVFVLHDFEFHSDISGRRPATSIAGWDSLHHFVNLSIIRSFELVRLNGS